MLLQGLRTQLAAAVDASGNNDVKILAQRSENGAGRLHEQDGRKGQSQEQLDTAPRRPAKTSPGLHLWLRRNHRRMRRVCHSFASWICQGQSDITSAHSSSIDRIGSELKSIFTFS